MNIAMKFAHCIIILLAVTITACDSDSGSSRVQAIPAPAASSSNSSTSADALQIKTQDGQELGTIRTSGTTQYLTVDGASLTGNLKGVKRKYQRAGQVVAEVKSADAEGFKLRNPDGSLRWKVKLYEDRVKISDNEENENPYQIRTSEGKFKLKDADGAEIGRIVQEGESVFVNSDQVQFILKAPYKMSYGVLLIEEMTRQDQMILLAELRDRGY